MAGLRGEVQRHIGYNARVMNITPRGRSAGQYEASDLRAMRNRGSLDPADPEWDGGEIDIRPPPVHAGELRQAVMLALLRADRYTRTGVLGVFFALQQQGQGAWFLGLPAGTQEAVVLHELEHLRYVQPPQAGPTIIPLRSLERVRAAVNRDRAHAWAQGGAQ